MWHRKKQSPQPTPLKDAVARQVASGIVRLQQRLSHWLQRWESKCSHSQKLVLFLLFFLLGSGCCAYLMATALFDQKRPPIFPQATEAGGMPPSLPLPYYPKPDSTSGQSHKY